MTTPSLYNPVAGYIRPVGWSRPAGNTEWKVTSTYAQHVASGRGPGIDLGNTRCGDPLYAMAGGPVSLAGTIPGGSAALVVRILHPQFNALYGGRKVESGEAHLNDIVVKVGQVVQAGQLIGHHGKTGATLCHCHGGFKVYGIGTPGDELDWWPFLYQNKAGWITTASINIRQTPGAGTTPGPLFAASELDGRIHRTADHKDLGLSSTHRGIRQPIQGARWTLPSGATGTTWIPIWLDGAFRYVATPLLAIS